MRANDTGCGKFLREMLDIRNRGFFHVEDGNARTVFGNAGSQFAQGLDLAD